MNIGKHFQMYSEDLKIKNYSDRTIKNYCSQVKLFNSEISELHIKKWLLNSTALLSHKISAIK